MILAVADPEALMQTLVLQPLRGSGKNQTLMRKYEQFSSFYRK